MKKLIAKIRAILRNRRVRKIWMRTISSIACLVVFITTYALVLPAITMESEAACGIEAHQHDESCYEERLICNIPESDGHKHTADCYSTTQKLICDRSEHLHTSDCYDEEGNLTCSQEEHQHGEECYEEIQELICGLEESEGHHHDSSCYEKVLTCEKEVHTHSPACYREDAASVAATEHSAIATTTTTSADDAAMDETANASGTFDPAETAAEGYVPTLDELDFRQLLNDYTTIYYHRPEDSTEDSGQITDWQKVDEDTVLGETDILRVYLAYTIPAGSLNETNATARYRLPGNLHLTDEQMETINQMENGLSGLYLDYDTLQITDTEKHSAYLGAEAVDGFRTPDQTIEDYLSDNNDTGDGEQTAQEIISAVVKADQVYDEDGVYGKKGAYLGTDLVFTFSPYTILKNRNEYDSEGTPVKAGESVSGWFALDFNMDQVDWDGNAAEITFVSEDNDLNTGLVSVALKKADPTSEETPQETNPSSEESPDSNNSDDEKTFNENSSTEENKAETVEETHPAVSFEDSLIVHTGNLSSDTDAGSLPNSSKMTVSVSAEAGTFPAGTTMVLSAVTDMDAVAEAVEGTVDSKTCGFQAVDISFRDKDGNEIEPLKPISVTMRSDSIKAATEDSSMAPVVVHVEDQSKKPTDTASDLVTVIDTLPSSVDTNDNSESNGITDSSEAISFKADSFSIYAIVYTVDFEYSVNGKMYQFSLPGGEKIALSELVEVLGILDGTNFADTDAFLKEVKGVEFSDPALVKVTQMEGDWELESLEPFTTEESLTITMKNGDVITVKVTDDQESSNLGDFLTKVTVSGASVVDGHYVVEQGKTYNVTMNFKETANLQFDNEGNLTYNLPEGITLPEGTTKTIKIAVVSGGKTYEIPATVTANGTTVTVKFDETDPNYNKLAQATNVGFRVSVDAQFTENINKTQWGSKMDKDIILDTTDHSDAFAEKSGHFDESTGVFHYTVKVKANGDVTNVNVKDIISGNALIFNNDVQVTGNSSSYTNNGLSAGQKGFDYTFASMADGEEIIITYSASLDQTVAKNSDTITADQTKNTVTVQKEDGEPHNAVYSQEINMKSPQKSDGTIAGVTADGDKLYNWTIDYNPLALVSAAGDKIKDSIGASSQEYMKYYGNVTVKVYDHAGTLVDTRSFTPGSDSSWEYTIPTGDTTPYHYVFEYQTIVDETKVIEGGSSLELKNEVEGKGGKDSGKIDVGPTDETTIEKSAESFNQQEITWSAVVHVGEGGLNKAEVIDTLPNRQLQDYNWELGIDLFKEGSLTVEGLVAGENYTVDSTSDPKQVKIVFTKDGQPGLKGVPGGHDIKIKLTTKVDQRWLHEAELYGSYWQTHQNAISINGKSDTAEVEIGAAGVEKKVSKTTVTIDGEQKTAFEYNIVLKNVYDDSIVVTDTFDKDLLYLLEDPNHNKNSTNDINLHIYGGNQYNQNDPREGALINYSESENGVIFRSDSLPKDANGNPYSYYRICYFLVLKDGVDLDALAVENGGKYSVTNKVNWGDHEGTATYEHKYDFLNKELVQEATATDRHVKYKVTYNLAKGELNGGQDLQMTDRLNENLSIDYTSIHIETDPAGVNIPYSLSGDGAETVATYTIPDSTAVIITYDAMVVGNGSVNYKNTVEANGEIKKVEKTTNINVEGEGEGATALLKITKVDGYDANKKLAGVKFKLYAEDGRSLKRDENVTEIILQTDENGVLTIDGSDLEIFLGATASDSVKYYLEEVAPPDGYGTISFPYQFTLVDDINGVDYEHYTYFFNDSFQIKNWPLEGLVVGKNVESDEEADHTKEFTFEVSILTEDGQVDTSVNQKYGDMTFVDGVATFTLKDKEQASAWSMPSGTKFKVEEKDADGFTVSATSGETTTEGAVFTGETSGEYTLVTFNNTKTREKTEVTVKKVWDPTPDSGSVTVELHRYAKITQGTINLTLTDQNGAPVPGATFQLCKDGSAQEGTYTTNANGKISISGLDKGSYYLKQTAAPDGYSMGDPAPQTETLTVTDVTTVQKLDSNLSNTKLKTTGSATITLTSTVDNSAISGAGFSLYKDGSLVISGTTNANGQVTFDNLSAGSYTVKQTSTNSDLKVAADQTFEIIGTEDKELTFTNIAKPVVYKVHIHSDAGSPGAYHQNWYKYYEKGTEVTVKIDCEGLSWVTDQTHEVKVDGVSKGSFKYDEPLTFSFNVSSNIEIEISNVGYSNGGNIWNKINFSPDSNASEADMAVTNTASSKRLSKALKSSAALKTAGNSVSRTDATPASAPTGYAEDSEFEPISYTLTGDEWSYTFPEQDKKDANGNLYYYYVVETAHTPTDYWIDSYSGDLLSETGTITIINKKEDEKGKFTVNKTWAGVTDAADLAALQAGFTVTVTGTGAGGSGVNTKTFSYSELPATIENLPLDATYSITESNTATDTLAKYNVVSESTTDHFDAAVPSESGTTYTLVNTYEKKTGSLKITKSVTVNGSTIASDATEAQKKLADGTYTFEIWNADGTSQVTTKADGTTPVGSLQITVTNGVASPSELTVDGLAPGTYVVKESGNGANGGVVLDTSSEGYDPDLGGIKVTVKGNDVDGVKTAAFTNNYETTTASVKKIWIDNNNSKKKRPDSLSVTLYADGVATDHTVTLTPDSWQSEVISGLPKYENGEEIDYYWVEGTMPAGYFLTGNTSDGTVTTLTNTLSEYDLKTSYTGTKTWNDEGNKYSTRPGELKVILYANDEPTDYRPVWVKDDANNRWVYTFKDIPVFDSNGEIIHYRAEEETPAGYSEESSTTEATAYNWGTATVVRRNDCSEPYGMKLDSLLDLSFLVIRTTNKEFVIWTHRVATPYEYKEIEKLARSEWQDYDNANRTHVYRTGLPMTFTSNHGTATVEQTSGQTNSVTLSFSGPNVWTHFIFGHFEGSQYNVGTASFTNKLDTTELSGSKIWKLEGDTHPSDDPILTLTRTSAATTTPEIVKVKEGQNEVNLQPEWSGTGKTRSFTYSGLPAKDKAGNPYTYAVTEYQFTINGITYTVSKTDGGYIAIPDPEHAATAKEIKVTQVDNDITNTETTDFEFSKIWNDIGSNPTTWPEGATITVTMNAYTETSQKAVDDVQVTLSAEGSAAGVTPAWTATLNADETVTTFKVEGLSKYQDGKELHYYVTETQVNGYKAPSYATTEGNSIVFTGSDVPKATDGQQIINTPVGGYELPSTGGTGTRLFTILGSILILGAGLLLWRRGRFI